MIQATKNASLKSEVNIESFNFDIIDNTIIFYKNSSQELIKAFKLSTIFSQAAARASSSGAESNITSDSYYGQLTNIYNNLGWINTSAGMSSLPISFNDQDFITAFTKITSGLTQGTDLNIQSMFECIFENSISIDALVTIMNYWWNSSTREHRKINFGIGVFISETDNDSAVLRCNYFNFNKADVYDKPLFGRKKELNWATWRSFFEKYNHSPLNYNTNVRNFSGKLKYDRYLPNQKSLEDKISPKQEREHVRTFSFS